MFYKAVITSKGLALDAKIKAGQTTAAFTRVKLGDGTYGEQEDLKGATNLKNTRNEFGISSIKVIDENTVRIRIVTNNSSLNSGYYISELALFATDPDEGEILYSISLGVPEKMDYQPSETEMFNATATIDMLTSISDAETANIQTGTGAAASAEDLAELETRIEGIETPEFDASGAVDGITGKTTLLASFVTKMPLAKFMRNVVAGFKLVLYAGQIVNNCVTDNASLPLSAAQGKVLMDLYTVLNTKITNNGIVDSYSGDAV
ncbi:phage tail protein, partial [Enterocloster bolteae]